VSITPHGAIQLTLVGHAGFSYVIEYSEDLVTWVPLAYLPFAPETIQFTDSTDASSARRFYRAVKYVYCQGPT